MASSQNCVFDAHLATSDEYLPPGEPLAGRIASLLRGAGYQVSEPELAHGACWSVVVAVGDKHVESVLMGIEDNKVFLQVRPEKEPGFIGRLLNRSPSADPDSVLAVAEAISEALRSDGFAGQLWCWDGFPLDEPSTDVPRPDSSAG